MPNESKNTGVPHSGINIERAAEVTARLGEGPVWDVEDQALWWVDITAGVIHRHDPLGTDTSWQVGEDVGCLALRQHGGLVVATRSGFHLFDTETGIKTAIADPEEEKPESRFNDGTTDPRGRFWAGTMKDRGQRAPVSSFWRLNPNLKITRGHNGVSTTNGLAFSPDGATMYFADTAASVQTIWQADYDLETGEHTAPRHFFATDELPGRPDGGTVDADGCYWMAGIGGWQVVRITPDGEVDRVIEVPVERPSKPMFGGSQLETLYVTSISDGVTEGTADQQPLAGSLLAIEGHGAQGVPQTRFAG